MGLGIRRLEQVVQINSPLYVGFAFHRLNDFRFEPLLVVAQGANHLVL